MTTLPIRRIILYKHGIGYFERRGAISGEQLRLSFPREAMDDMLKSMIALDLGPGQVLSVDFETPEDRAALLAKGSIHLSDNHSLLDLLRDLRGRHVRCILGGPDQETTIEGLIIGVDYETEQPLRRAIVSIYQPERHTTQTITLDKITQLELLDSTAITDLDYFLRAAQSEKERRGATLHLSSGEHDLLVGYIAPAPAWRVSYRMLYEDEETPTTATTSSTQPMGKVLLQGWGLFDNQLDEDLEDVRLTLIAGMPISFRYRLYEPRIPNRPFVEDEERTVNAPIFFNSMPAATAAAPRAYAYQTARDGDRFMAKAAAEMEDFALDDMEESLQVATSGSERGALFAYEVDYPISVARGRSAMVPIVSQRLACRRDLLYNGRKLPKNPVTGLRLINETGLTLERGPVTVLEHNSYVGEAVIPFTRAGGDLVVPFAVELGITVEEQYQHERSITAIDIRDEYLLIQEYDIQQTIYTVTNTLQQTVNLIIEHTLRDNYELTETIPPVERNARLARWNVVCATSAQTTFIVQERFLSYHHELVRSLNGKQLQTYLQEKALDAATAQALEEALQLYHRIEESQTRLHQIAEQRNAIYQQQRQIQGNLTPLSHEGEEGALRKRYVNELHRLEDQLKALDFEEQQLKEHIATLNEQVRTQLRELTRDKNQTDPNT